MDWSHKSDFVRINYNVMPNSKSNISFAMSHDESAKKCSSNEQSSSQCQNIPRKRRWSIGRLYSIESDDKNINHLERRMTLPLLKPKANREPKCELKTLVQNQGTQETNHNESLDHISLNSIFKFWKPEEDLRILLTKMDVSSHTDILKICDMINEKSSENTSIAELSKLVQDVYRIADFKIKKQIFADEVSEERGKKILIKFENKLMKGLHEDIFQKILIEEEEHDQKLADIIENLSWITPKHLLAKVDDSDKAVSDIFDKAMLDIATIYFKESPVAKLKCIMSCSKRIFDILRIQHEDLSEPADDFLSILVFVILQANPARLHSNIRYILQFGNCEEIIRSEEGYYFTNLCSVVSFIENLNAQSLNLSEEEFQHFCTISDQLDGNEDEIRSYQISCSRRLSLKICKIYHQAADGFPSELKENDFYKNSSLIQKYLAR